MAPKNISANLSQFTSIIDQAYEKPTDQTLSAADKSTVLKTIQLLDAGKIRVSVFDSGKNVWQTQAWIKKAILLYFRIQKSVPIRAGQLEFFDKLPLKKWKKQDGVRVVPQATARFGSYLEPGVILMPSYVNIGAYVGSGTMVDTWATVGSCAQVGRNVHLSGGVGLGGVLEPLQANPVIIEDDVFVGSRCIIVEGIHVEAGAVLGAGVTLTASTPIIDVTGSTPQVHKGRVPKNSVVIPGSRSKDFPAGRFEIPCALIIGKRSESTDRKTSLNQVLRDL